MAEVSCFAVSLGGDLVAVAHGRPSRCDGAIVPRTGVGSGASAGNREVHHGNLL